MKNLLYTLAFGAMSFLLVVGSLPCAAQVDPGFSLITNTGMYYNPAMAGSIQRNRFVASYRNQWVQLKNGQAAYFGYDGFVKKAPAGIGLIGYYDQQPDGHNTYVGGIYAHKFQLNERWGFSAGAELGYLERTYTVPEWIVVDPNDPALPPSGATFTAARADFGAGVLLNSRDAYVGFAVDHINNPDFRASGYTFSNAPRHYILHGGYVWQPNDESPLSVAATGVVRYADQNLQALGILAARVKWLMIGVGYNYNTLFMAGVYHERFMLGYSYNLPPNEAIEFGASHELSIKYALKR